MCATNSPTTPGAATVPATVITGASEGIGLALARKFLSKGHTVVAIARNSEKLAAALSGLAPMVTAQHRLLALPLDVTDPDAAARIAGMLADNGLHLDVLINNAGIGLGGPFASQAPADVDRLVALNIAALTRLTHAAVATMLQRGRGHIINIASLGGYAPGPNQAAYYASKAFVISLSEALSSELAGSGVKMTVVAPGPVDTGFHATMNADDAFYRRLLPALTADQVAAATYRGYRLGLRVVVPGIFNRGLMLAMRLLPHPITVPLTGWLLAPRSHVRPYSHR